MRLTCYALGHVGLSYVLIVVVRVAVFAAFVPFPPEVCGRLLSQRTEALAVWRCSSGRKTLLSEGNLNQIHSVFFFRGHVSAVALSILC